MQYRREIDGLRAWAVVPVILFHAGFDVFRGGFVGVDIFFVISGYLITSIIARELDAGSFSIVRFYERRARRILPALYLILALSTVAAWLLFLPSDLEDFMASAVAVVFFASNFRFYQTVDYFSVDAEINPLLHTWSLAVEEQYYIVFPLLLMLFWKIRRRWVVGLLAIVFVASLAYAQWESHHAAELAYYMLTARAWELLIGSFVALYLKRFGHLQNPLINQTGSLAGLALIAFSIVWISEAKAYPSVYTLPSTLGAGLVILCAVPGTWANRVLGWRPAVGIGLVSYSAYLWHQPLFAFARYRQVEEPSSAAMLGLALAVFPLAYLSWRYVEAPFRDKRRTSRPTIFLWSGVAGAALAAVGVAGYLGQGVPDRAVVRKLSLLDYQPDNRHIDAQYWNDIRAETGDPAYGVLKNDVDQRLWFRPSPKLKILVLGNSHSKDLYSALRASETVSEHAQVARFGVQVRWLTERFFGFPNYRAADVVIVESLYGGDELKNFDWFVDHVIADGKKIVVMKAVHAFPYGGGATLADEVIAGAITNGERAGARISDAVNAAYYQDFISGRDRDNSATFNARIDDLARRHPQLVVLDRMDLLCRDVERRCHVVDERLNKFIFDKSHYSAEGARYYGQRIDTLGWAGPILD